MPTAYLNIGSNSPQAMQIILGAVQHIARRYRAGRLRLAPWQHSPAWGYRSEHPFTNLGVALDFQPGAMPPPLDLLEALQDIERTHAPGAHRQDDGTYTDRRLDIDIIHIDGVAMQTPRLTLPHPRARARAFVMQPMQFLCPGWQPAPQSSGRKKTIADLHRPTPAQYLQQPKIPLVLVLDNIRSMHNIGSMFRSADAFALRHIMLCGITATPPRPEIHKTALGAEETVPWSHHPDTLQCLQTLATQGYTLCCLEQVNGSVNLADFTPHPSQKYALVVGNEVDGVQAPAVDLCTLALEIRQYGTKHSLNVAVSAALAMFHFNTHLNGRV